LLVAIDLQFGNYNGSCRAGIAFFSFRLSSRASLFLCDGSDYQLICCWNISRRRNWQCGKIYNLLASQSSGNSMEISLFNLGLELVMRLKCNIGKCDEDRNYNLNRSKLVT